MRGRITDDGNQNTDVKVNNRSKTERILQQLENFTFGIIKLNCIFLHEMEKFLKFEIKLRTGF